MLVGEKLAPALEGFEPRAMEGVGYRSLDLRFVGTPLSGLGASLRGARFTPRGGPAMLYLALSRLTVELEVGGLYHAPDGLHSAKLPPRATMSVEFSLASVLDLCAPQVLERLGSNPQEFFGP